MCILHARAYMYDVFGNVKMYDVFGNDVMSNILKIQITINRRSL